MADWVQQVHPKKCGLKHWMGIPCQENIPERNLRAIAKTPVGGKWCGPRGCRTVTGHVKLMNNFALVARGFKHPGRSKRVPRR